MDALAFDRLLVRVKRLRSATQRTVRDAQTAKARAAEVSQATSLARRRRWESRYQEAFARHSKSLRDLGRLGD
jgi:hypothetical protein